MQKAVDAIHTQFLEYVEYLRSIVQQNVQQNEEPNDPNENDPNEHHDREKRPYKRRRTESYNTMYN